MKCVNKNCKKDLSDTTKKIKVSKDDYVCSRKCELEYEEQNFDADSLLNNLGDFDGLDMNFLDGTYF